MSPLRDLITLRRVPADCCAETKGCCSVRTGGARLPRLGQLLGELEGLLPPCAAGVGGGVSVVQSSATPRPTPRRKPLPARPDSSWASDIYGFASGVNEVALILPALTYCLDPLGGRVLTGFGSLSPYRTVWAREPLQSPTLQQLRLYAIARSFGFKAPSLSRPLRAWALFEAEPRCGRSSRRSDPLRA